MFDTAFNLRRTTGFIRTIMGRLPFRTIQRRTAFRASLDKSNLRTQQHRTGIDIDTNNLRNDLSAFFYIYIISQMQIQPFNNICVMQRGTLDGRPSQQYRFQVGNRSNGPCASYLETDRVETCYRPLCLKFISNSPTGTLGGESQILLLAQ